VVIFLFGIDFWRKGWYNEVSIITKPTEVAIMKHIKTIETRNLCDSAKNGGCGECQTSCQSACKTSCGIANQQCESTKESK
jgi:predicted ribosomally synthesized six-cysteine peptide SCIFF